MFFRKAAKKIGKVVDKVGKAAEEVAGNVGKGVTMLAAAPVVIAADIIGGSDASSKIIKSAEKAGDVVGGIARAPVSMARSEAKTITTTAEHLCAGDVKKAATELAQGTGRAILSAPLAPAHAYRGFLRQQVTSWKSLPDHLQEILAPHYPINLSKVRYAENIDTVHKAAITLENEIFLPNNINLHDKRDLWVFLHELAHVRQYEVHGGFEPFLVKYLINGGIQMAKHGTISAFEIHDEINLEKEANRKADDIIEEVCEKFIPSYRSPRPF